jgi:hypothetical protein
VGLRCREMALDIEDPWGVDSGCSGAQTEVANPLSLEATYVTRSPLRRTDRDPNQSWRYLCFVGTQSFDLADYVAFAGRRRENVEARGDRWEHRCAIGAPIVVNPTPTISALALRAATFIRDNLRELSMTTRPMAA